MKKEEIRKLIDDEENLYKEFRNIIKGKQTSTVKSILERLNNDLINISLIQ